MFTKKHIALLVSSAMAVMAMNAMAAQGPSSSLTPYVNAIAPGVKFTSILTAGDIAGNGYRMSGIPDGLGAYDNGDGTITVLMNHEIDNLNGVVRAHGAKGSFVSEWVINKRTLRVISGGDLIKNVFGWNAANQQSDDFASTVTFSRFCSADLASQRAFFNPRSGLGSHARIFLNGEEGGATGYAVAHVATGPSKGSSFILGKFNAATNASGGSAIGGWENLLANPFPQDKTVVIGINDGGTGIMSNALVVYAGTKTNTGSEADKAGLTNGVAKFVNVDGIVNEISNAVTRTSAIVSDMRFSLSDTASTHFSRPEDGAWNPRKPNEFYFVTTDQLDKTDLTGGTQKGGTRLWRLTFDDIKNIDAGGKIDIMLDSSSMAGGVGVDKPNMFDNISVNVDGTITLQEDVGNAEHNGKMWQFNPVDGSFTLLSKYDPALFGDIVGGSFVAGTHTKDEESSGVIDITRLLDRHDGKKYELFVVQDHASAASLQAIGALNAEADPVAMYQGGQLVLMSAPLVHNKDRDHEDEHDDEDKSDEHHR
ncbi:MAG: DUF839 domain-containing protein [Gammaproteobacteria bacterium]|nr:DUF839 domain-containing protein [Gammaproteobacteria bacterium]MBU1978594.1 DUF839 domain-containing protein [Gammaproteobacteria bacterium]